MIQPRRLFDLIFYQQEQYPKLDMLAAKNAAAGDPESWQSYSTDQVIRLSEELALQLLSMGMSADDFTPEHQDKIALLSQNRPEWIITDLAIQQTGCVSVPIYPTISILELEYVLRESEAKVAFVSDAAMYQKVAELRPQLPNLQHVFSFDQIPGVRHWKELLVPQDDPKAIAALHQCRDTIQSQHLVTIIYTSGTTGFPKGVMLTHQNILSNVLSTLQYLPVDQQGRALSFLPLNHVYERMISYLYIYAGVSIYYAENMDSIGKNLLEVRPSIFTTVPRLLEKVYERIMAKGFELKGIKRALFFWSVNLGKRYNLNQNPAGWYHLRLALARKLVFSKWKAALGGNIQVIVTGSAACQERLLRLFTAAGIPILEGYGLTETSPVISVNRMEEKERMFGTVGPAIEGVEVKIAADGEILCKGPNIMLGYYKHPELTFEAMQDGWFHTGDIGTLVEGKFLKITDRKKELFKTSGGKYVAPLPIENKMKESPYIEQIMVVGNNRKFASALIVPNFSHILDWGKRQKLEFRDRDQMIHHPRVVELISQAVNRYNLLLNHVEQIKKFTLLPEEWTIEGGELTPTLKLKRKVIESKFENAIEKMYA